MRTMRWLMCVVAVSWLAGCASVEMKVDSGPIVARTFSFVPRGPGATDPLPENEQKVHALIQEAITANLAARGVSRVDAGGDVVVAYLVIIGDGTITTYRDEYFGFDSDAGELMSEVHARSLNQGGRNYRVAGTLVIDVLDSAATTLLKRSTIQSELLRTLAPDVRVARLQAAVDQALSDLRMVQ
jgi:hypothetical protein